MLYPDGKRHFFCYILLGRNDSFDASECSSHGIPSSVPGSWGWVRGWVDVLVRFVFDDGHY